MMAQEWPQAGVGEPPDELRRNTRKSRISPDKLNKFWKPEKKHHC